MDRFRRWLQRSFAWLGNLDTLRSLPELVRWVVGVTTLVGSLVGGIGAWLANVPWYLALPWALLVALFLWSLSLSVAEKLGAHRADGSAASQLEEAVPASPAQPPELEALDESSEIREVRRQAGWLCERLGDHGLPLSEEEDDKARASLGSLRVAAGNLAHRQHLRQGLRDFISAAGWMLRYKSRRTDGGLQHFSSAEDSIEARHDLEKSYQSLVDQCGAILDGEHERQIIEIEVEQGFNIAIMIPAHSSPEPTGHKLSLLDAYLGGIKILNHDTEKTHIDRIWLEIPGAKALPEFDPNTHQLEGERQIAGRSIGRYRLTQKSVYEGEIDTDDIRGSIRLRVAATGCLKPLSYALPDHCFEPNQY